MNTLSAKMACSGTTATRLIGAACLMGALLILPKPTARAQNNTPALKLLISMSQPFVAEPDAARIRLHVHNPTQQTLWLYRRAKGKHPAEQIVVDEGRPAETTGGSTVEIKLWPADPKAAQTAISPAIATVLEYVNMPKPRLVKLAGGGDYEETSIVHLQPAMAEGQKEIWGAYQGTVEYGASFSNAEASQRIISAHLWQGEVTSNTVTFDLRPPLPDSVGVVSGTSLGPDLKPRSGVRVSLSDEQGQLIDQHVTREDGQFSFTHLPRAFYWITGRREGAVEDTVTFKHEELTSSSPSADVQLVFYPPEVTEAKQMVHKPTLLRVFDPGGKPLAGIEIEAVFSNGDVLDDVKGTTDDEGFAAMELLPGRSSVSLKRHGCGEQNDRADVASGGGVDVFKYVFNCAKR